MLRFTGQAQDGTPLIGLGITADNVVRLRMGQPILLRGAETNSPADVFIAYSDTAEGLLAELRRAGLVTDATRCMDLVEQADD